MSRQIHGRIVVDPIRSLIGSFPGVTELDPAWGRETGFFIPYRNATSGDEPLDKWEAVVELLLIDLSPTSHFIDTIPFLIDTGCHLTMIPRCLVPGAFPAREAVEPHLTDVSGLAGGAVVGRLYAASISLMPSCSDYEAHTFHIGTVLVLDHWQVECAVLGLDALRQLVMVSDSEGISLWPLHKAIEIRGSLDTY